MTSARILIPWLILSGFLIGCEEDERIVEQSLPAYSFETVVHFDTSEFVLVKSYDSERLFAGEKVVNWEVWFGEPFVDVNGNGIYEQGLDLFVILPPGQGSVDTLYFECLVYLQ